MIDTKGGHYAIILETQWKKNVLDMEDALGDELGRRNLLLQGSESTQSQPT